MKLQIVIFLIVQFCWVVGTALADQAIEDMVKQGISKSQGFASSDESGKYVPNSSKEKASEEAEKLAKIDDGELKSKANEKMLSANSNTVEGITRDAMNKKALDGFENHEMFKKADEIWKDPLSEMEKITSKDCKERIKDQKNQYTKRVIKEKHYDTELYEEICEKPASEIMCEKTLVVTCDRMSECGYDAGGIIKESIEGNIFWRTNYPKIELGTIDIIHQRRECGLLDKKITFNIKNKELIRTFTITNIAYSDWIRITVNGVQVLNTTGGDGEYVRRQGDSICTSCYEFCQLISGGVTKTCNTKKFYNISPNVDLRPYLKDGSNTMRIGLAFGNRGQLYLECVANQYCCSETNDKWEKRCWQN